MAIWIRHTACELITHQLQEQKQQQRQLFFQLIQVLQKKVQHQSNPNHNCYGILDVSTYVNPIFRRMRGKRSRHVYFDIDGQFHPPETVTATAEKVIRPCLREIEHVPPAPCDVGDEVLVIA